MEDLGVGFEQTMGVWGETLGLAYLWIRAGSRYWCFSPQEDYITGYRLYITSIQTHEPVAGSLHPNHNTQQRL